jgi:excisionase family DNA binding protein
VIERASGQPEARPRFHTVAEAAAILRTCDMTVYRAIRSGGFPAVKIRGRYVIPARALDEMEAAAVSGRAVVDAANWAGGSREATAQSATDPVAEVAS